MPKRYVPERCDIVWLDFQPQTGHEQGGRRPAIVISPKQYNQKSGLAIFCPITTIEKGYPFEVKLMPNSAVQGVILADQVKSLDWQARRAKLACRSNPETFRELLGKLKALIR